MPKAEKTVAKTQDVRRIKKSLKCKFTDAEVLQLGRDLAEKTEQYGQLEADKKQVTKDFDAKLAESRCADTVSQRKSPVRLRIPKH